MSRPINLQRRLTRLASAPAALAAVALALVGLTQWNEGNPAPAAISAGCALFVAVASVLAIRRTASDVEVALLDTAGRGAAIIDGEPSDAGSDIEIEELALVNDVLDALGEQQRILREQSEALEAGAFDDPILDAEVPGPGGNVVKGSVDILRQAGAQLRDSETVNASLMDSVSDAIVVVDHEGLIVASNMVAKVALDLFGGSLGDTLPEWKELPNGEHDFSRPLADGSLTLTQLSKTQMVTSTGAVTMLCWRDVSGESAVQSQIANVARTDIVTGLPNRHGLMVAHDRLAELGRGASVIHVDLAEFSQINQRHGFSAGDHILQVLSDRLRSIVRDGDTVARVSGDEFIFLLESDAGVVDSLAHRILDRVAEPIELANGANVSISANAGWSTGPVDQSYELLRRANYALGEAKADAERVGGYSDDVAQRDANRRDWEQQLRRAIAKDEFVLYAQPIVDIFERKVVGVEIFLRWRHPSGRMISPAEFISIAEESELIADIDRWVIQQCVHAAGNADPDLVFSLNVSSRFMAANQMADYVSRTLAESDLPAGRIQIDVTETNVAADVAGVIESIRSLNAMGVKVALDDFGTGYSSLAHLLKLAVSTIKIDRRMVSLVTEDEGRGVVAAIMAFARKRKLDVVAEGVESEDEVSVLAELGCQLQQGYHHARPAPLPDVLTSLESIASQTSELVAALEARTNPPLTDGEPHEVAAPQAVPDMPEVESGGSSPDGPTDFPREATA